MPVSNTIKAKGLYTFSNYYSEVPEGALSVADNVNIDRDGIIEPRRGFKQYAELTGEAKQLMIYKGATLAHHGSSLAYYNGSGYINYSGTHSEVETGLRVKGVEVNGNFYFTTNEGIKKLAADSQASLATIQPTIAGGLKSVNTYLRLNAINLGFLEGGKKVAYRVLWGTKDINGNLILGYPSTFNEIENNGSNSCNVDVTFAVPAGVTTDYFFQIYRTTLVDIAAELTDEMKLVYEQAHDGSTEYTIIDLYPEDLRLQATSLYTNEFSGEGIAQANIQPHVSKDITTYKNHTFYANTRSKQFVLNTLLGISDVRQHSVSATSIPVAGSLELTVGSHAILVGHSICLLGSGATNGFYTVTSVTATTITIATNATFAAITGGAVVYPTYLTLNSNQYYFVGRRQHTKFVFDSAVSSDYDGDYVIIYSAEDQIKYVLYFSDNPATVVPTVPGGTFIKVDITGLSTIVDIVNKFEDVINSTAFDLEVASTPSTPPGESWIETSSSGFTTDAFDGSDHITITTVTQGIGVDSSIAIQTSTKRLTLLSTYLSTALKIQETTSELMNAINATPSTPVYGYYISSQEGLPGEFTLEATTFTAGSFTLDVSPGDTIFADNFNVILPQTSEAESFPNRLYYSKVNQPEATTLASYIDVGPKDKAIKRIIGLRDSLFIFKEDAIYRLYGANPLNFAVSLFDSSANIVAPDTAAILNNRIHVLTSQGVATVSETGVFIISRPIENYVLKVNVLPNHDTLSFAVTSEVDRAYIMFFPENSTDTSATRAYRYNSYTQTWTSWVKTYTCGVSDGDKLYFGSGIDAFVEVERKDLTRKDYTDRVITNKVLAEKLDTKKYRINTLSSLRNHDVLVQTQKLTISQYNRVVQQLNSDPILSVQVGFTPIDSAVAGQDMAASLTALRLILTTYDPAGTYPATSGLNTATALQNDFNALVAGMNASTGIHYFNYPLSSGTTEYEAPIIEFGTDVLTSDLYVTLSKEAPFILGSVDQEQGIESKIVWSPMVFGDPIGLKHVREGRIYFESTSFEGGSLGYNSDISANFEDIDFTTDGSSGDFGLNTFSSFTWGGEGLQYPFRTLIPRQKQRCRMMRTRFTHDHARDKFSVYGISYVFEMTSVRTNK